MSSHRILTTPAERPEQGFRSRPVTDYLVTIDGQPRGWLMSYRPGNGGYYLADLHREPVFERGTPFHVTVATKADFREQIERWLEVGAIPPPNAPPKPKWDVATPDWVKALPLRDDQHD